MTRRHILIAGLIVSLFLLLALPASAFGAGGEPAGMGGGTIDPGLKEELWNIHVEHRLSDYEYHVGAAQDAIAALGRYGYDTARLSEIVSTISAKHDALETALKGKDRDQLKAINSDLRQLWKEYSQEFRRVLRGN